MTINPKWGMWISIAAMVVSALALCGTELTTIFGAVETAKILAALGIGNAIINGVNGVLHMIPSQSGPVAAKEFPLGPTTPKVVAGLAILIIGLTIMPSIVHAQGLRRPAVTGNLKKDIQTDLNGGVPANTPLPSLKSITKNQANDIATFLTDLAAIPDAVALSTSIPGLQDPVGNACWKQFSPLGDLIKAHPLLVSGKAAADIEALRLAAIGMNQICANPNCGQMFVDATNAAAAIAGVVPISLASLCSKIPVIGTSAVPTAVVPSAGIGTVAAPITTPAPATAQ